MAAKLIMLICFKYLPFRALYAFQNHQYSTRFYDRNNNLVEIMALDDGLRREWTPIDKIPLEVQKVFIEAEDSEFYKHRGVHLPSVLRAAFQNIKNARTVSGASTITMQLARMIVPRSSDRVSFGKKLQEAFNAVRIESKLSKQQILELYLNNLPFGFRTEGITSAARNFYSANLYELTEEQIKTLSLIPRRPSLYIKQVPSATSFDYPKEVPHFVTWVKNQYKNRIIPPDVYLSVDASFSESVRCRIEQIANMYSDARVADGAALVFDNETGEIIVWCGSINFYKKDTGQIDGVLVKNQTGSSMKPFLYAMALENGFSPTSVLADVPTDYGTTEVYVPQNFNNRFNGPQLFRISLASSLNFPAVTLLYRLGVDRYIELLNHAGFESLYTQRKKLGLSLALGAGEVPLYELVRGFSVFARGGTVRNLRFTTVNSEIIEKIETEVFSKDTAAIICDMLSDKDARYLGFGPAKVFDTPYPAIFKTGTSNQFQNIVALGSTKRYTAGVWMGNVTGETVIGETGSSIPAGVVRYILDNLESSNVSKDIYFEKPERYKKQKICALSGMLPTKYCTAIAEEYVMIGENLEPCNYHVFNNGKIEVHYPNEYQCWFGGKNMNGSLKYSGDFEFYYPKDNFVFIYDETLKKMQQLKVDVAGGNGHHAELFINGNSCGISERPFRWFIPIIQGNHFLEAVSETGETCSINILVK
ncbi:MAG: penicillin-binding protein 1C [Treponema sp.]|nr:penicillin-binding protein 1C [Treponema sp.]